MKIMNIEGNDMQAFALNGCQVLALAFDLRA